MRTIAFYNCCAISACTFVESNIIPYHTDPYSCTSGRHGCFAVFYLPQWRHCSFNWRSLAMDGESVLTIQYYTILYHTPSDHVACSWLKRTLSLKSPTCLRSFTHSFDGTNSRFALHGVVLHCIVSVLEELLYYTIPYRDICWHICRLRAVARTTSNL